MSWIIKSASNEVRFEGSAWVRVWVTSAEVEANERIVEIKTNYENALASIKASNVKPTEKISALKEAREEAKKQAEAIVDEVVDKIAGDKCWEVSNNAESKYSVKMEIDLKDAGKGSINNWDAIIWAESELEAELEIDEVTE